MRLSSRRIKSCSSHIPSLDMQAQQQFKATHVWVGSTARFKSVCSVLPLHPNEQRFAHVVLDELRKNGVSLCSMSRRSVEVAHGVSSVPQAAVSIRSKAVLYSITSSASNCIEFGTESPSALAVLKLIMNSNVAACKTGNSAGFSPLRIRPT
jgi:hypothetical protein